MSKYYNKKPYNNIYPKEDEELVPILAFDLIKWNQYFVSKDSSKAGTIVNLDNIETWHLGGRTIKVAFVAVPKEKAEDTIQAFWDETNAYLDATRKKRCLIDNGYGELIRCPACNCCLDCEMNYSMDRITSRTLSLDKCLEDSAKYGSSSIDPSGTTKNEDLFNLMETFNDLINEIEKQDEEKARILRLLWEEYDKKEIIEKCDINKGKTQAYAMISNIQKEAKELYDKKYR